MAQVTADMSMSLDGFIAGPHDGPDRPLGEGGDHLHRWVFNLASWRSVRGLTGGESNRDAEIVDESFRKTGAVIMGRRMFNNGKELWAGIPPFHVPVFILCHEAQDAVPKASGTTYNFVTDGIESALRQARSVAGDRNVSVAGGANVVQQYLAAGLLDEIQIHVVPVLLGSGIHLFERGAGHIGLEKVRAVETTNVTHLLYRIIG